MLLIYSLLFVILSLIGLSLFLFFHMRAQKRLAEAELQQVAFQTAFYDQKITEQFELLSKKALSDNTQSFLQLAQSFLSQHTNYSQLQLESKEKAIQALLEPLKETLFHFKNQMEGSEKSSLQVTQSLKEQISFLMDMHKDLRKETSLIAQALSTPQSRGRWGEMQLRRVVELTGMLKHCDFEEQVSFMSEKSLGGDEKNQIKKFRPDMLIHLPGNKIVVVDAKVPLTAYLEALETSDSEKKQRKLKEHATRVREHIQALGRKSYWEQFKNSPEFVVMFLPGENFFSQALTEDPSLLEFGIESKVVTATPTTLIALLRTIFLGWRHEAIHENTQRISALGGELYKRLLDQSMRLEELGLRISRLVDGYNEFLGSYQSRVLPMAKKFEASVGIQEGDKNSLPNSITYRGSDVRHVTPTT